jgi:DNA-binding beta-propeller fold protein YncE
MSLATRSAAIVAVAILAACTPTGGTTLYGATPSNARLDRSAHWTKTSLGKFADPYSVAVDPVCTSNCDVYVSDPGTKTIWLIKPNGDRTAYMDAARFPRGDDFDPQGIAVGASRKQLYFTEGYTFGGADQVWEIHPDGQLYVLPNLLAQSPLYIRGISVYDAGGRNVAIYAAAASKTPLLRTGYVSCYDRVTPDYCQFSHHDFKDPYDVAVATDKAVFVADARSKKVYRVAGGSDTEIGTFADPYAVAVNLDGKRVYVADAGSKNVQELVDGTWQVIGTFADPYGLAVDGSGDVYVADAGSKDVWKLTPR